MAATQITAELLRRYVAGQASDAEQHAVERAALEDPFVADALEGFQAMPSPVPTDLSQKLSARIASPRPFTVIYGRRVAVAAGLVGVLATAYVLLTSIPQTSPETPVVATKLAPLSSPALADTLKTEQPAIALQAKVKTELRAKAQSKFRAQQTPESSPDTLTIPPATLDEQPIMASRMMIEPTRARVVPPTDTLLSGTGQLKATANQPTVMARKKAAPSRETGSVARLKRSEITGELELETEADYAARTRDSVVVTEVPTVPPQPQGGMETVQAYLLEKSQQRLQGALLEISFRKNGSISRVRFLKNPGRVSRREVLLWLQQGPRWQAAFTAQGSVPFTLKLSL
ncbi:hypothetical protein [Siphonobacter sp.]|uniref:hypothetical protein n=1 Tax=Siphonobacter sp. TaxID=1869184 RepID=UPI003B3A7564